MKRFPIALRALLPICGACVAFSAFGAGRALAQCPSVTVISPSGIGARLSISGRVVNAVDNMDVSFVTVTLVGSNQRQMVVTDAQGRFLFECLESGQYLLEATKEGFQGARAMFAAPDSDAVIRMQPVSALTPVGSGAVLSARQMQIPEKARKLFDKGIEELYQNKKPEASLDYFRQAIDLHRDFDEAYVQMGTAYFRLARATDAEQTFRKAIEVYPKNGRAHMYLAELLSSQGKIGPAVEELGKAIENEDTLWQAHLDLARILAKQGKAKEALVHAARAHELNKASPEVHLTYYNACISTRDLAAALAELDEIGKLFPESDTAKKLLAIRPKLAADVAAKKP